MFATTVITEMLNRTLLGCKYKCMSNPTHLLFHPRSVLLRQKYVNAYINYRLTNRSPIEIDIDLHLVMAHIFDARPPAAVPPPRDAASPARPARAAHGSELAL